MSLLSIVHVLLGLVAVIMGCVIFALPKADSRHRLLGWLYLGCALTGLTAIIVGGLSHPGPFHGYAVVILSGLIAAILVSRFRSRVPAWRSWHGALMAFSMLGAAVAIGGVVGGLVLGVGKGPVYYRMFNAVIVCFSTAGLWIINVRPVLWGRVAGPRERTVRVWFSALVAAVSLALVLTQWILFSK
jgi:uncharacterized membrane protein